MWPIAVPIQSQQRPFRRKETGPACTIPGDVLRYPNTGVILRGSEMTQTANLAFRFLGMVRSKIASYLQALSSFQFSSARLGSMSFRTSQFSSVWMERKFDFQPLELPDRFVVGRWS